MSDRTVGAVVLAAGMATRMGQSKVLLPWGEGETILDHILTELKHADVSDIVVVTGHQADAVQAIAVRHDCVAVHNPDYAVGDMLSSLKTGIRALPDSALPNTIAATLMVLGDQPRIQAAIVRQVVSAYSAGQGEIVAPSYQMRRGHPILIDRRYWDELLALPPDGAARTVINAHADRIAYVNVETDSVLHDVDTPQDYAEERRRAGLV